MNGYKFGPAMSDLGHVKAHNDQITQKYVQQAKNTKRTEKKIIK